MTTDEDKLPKRREGTGRKPKVLVVEDDCLQAMGLESILQDAGCDVVGPTGHLDQALRLIGSSEIDVAFLDIQLAKNQTVFPVAELLKKRGIRFVFTTAFDRRVPRGSGFKELSLLKPLERSVVEKLVVFLTETPVGESG